MEDLSRVLGLHSCMVPEGLHRIGSDLEASGRWRVWQCFDRFWCSESRARS